MALIAVQLNNAAGAEELYPVLESLAGTISPTSPNGPGLAADRLLGLLARTLGNLETAAAHFESATAFCRRGGYRPELAWTCYDYADALGSRNTNGDQAKVVSLLEESLAISSELGMKPLMARVLSRREILKA